MSLTNEDESPAWAVTYSSFDEGGVTIAIRCFCKLFLLGVSMSDLENWSEQEEFQRLLLDAPDDNDAEESLYDLIWDDFLPFIKTHEMQTSEGVNSLSLQDFYGVCVTSFKLISNGASVQFVECPENLTLISSLLPQIQLSDIPEGEKIARVDASQIQIRSRYPNNSDIGTDTPAKVAIGDTFYFFKAVQDRKSFLREFKILLQLGEHRLNKKYRLPVLHSLVTYSDRPDTVMGFLLHHINHANTMTDWVQKHHPSQSLKEKWHRQIKDTTRALHRYGIVWGDVKPENILIDEEHNPWMVDFGGGYNSGYVDEEVMETIEGDNQGVSRLGGMLLHGVDY